MDSQKPQHGAIEYASHGRSLITTIVDSFVLVIYFEIASILLGV